MRPDKDLFKVLRGKIEKFLDEQQLDEETAKRVNSAVAYSNQTSFRSRPRELCSRITPATLNQMQIVPDEFIKIVVDSRNFLTHAGGSFDEKNNPLEDEDLFFLSQKMRTLLRGVFLLQLGFPESQFQQLIVREATKWR